MRRMIACVIVGMVTAIAIYQLKKANLVLYKPVPLQRIPQVDKLAFIPGIHCWYW
jgi:hypothetical protein